MQIFTPMSAIGVVQLPPYICFFLTCHQESSNDFLFFASWLVWPVTLSSLWFWIASSAQGPAMSHGLLSSSTFTPATPFHNSDPQEKWPNWSCSSFHISPQHRFLAGLWVDAPFFAQSAARGKVTWSSQQGIWTFTYRIVVWYKRDLAHSISLSSPCWPHKIFVIIWWDNLCEWTLKSLK